MPFTIKISEAEQIACVTASGVLDLEMCIQAAEDLAQRADFQPHYAVVTDFRQVPNVPSKTEVRKMAAFFRDNKEHFRGKTAMVVNRKDLVLAGMLCMLVSVFGMKMEAFDDMSLAIEHVRR